jgi:hypothetical protein
MSEKDSQQVKVKMLSGDPGYYASVFKKSEKIISVIFYVLSYTDKSQSDKFHTDRIKQLTFSVHDELLKTLALPTRSAHEGLLQLQYQLAGLESALRIAEAAGVIGSDVLEVLLEQFDLVQRYINNHYTKDASYSMELSQISAQLVAADDTDTESKTAPKKKPAAKAPRKQRVQIPAGDISTDAYLVYSQMTDRGERIKTVLEAKPQASIKDISEVITDVSEKTIQRELNSLIEQGEVVREGERRWSTYSVVKN